MGTDVASFARQLREDGIDAAKAEAAKIIEEAQKKADKLVATAKADAEKLEKEAETRIQQKKARSEDEIRLVARDLQLSFKKEIDQVGIKLLSDKIDAALNSEEVIKAAVSEIIKGQNMKGDWELSLSEKIGPSVAQAAVAMFRSQGGTAKLGESLKKAGFEVKHDSEVFEITEKSISESFAKLLSPALKALLEA